MDVLGRLASILDDLFAVEELLGVQPELHSSSLINNFALFLHHVHSLKDFSRHTLSELVDQGLLL